VANWLPKRVKSLDCLAACLIEGEVDVSTKNDRI
jgi:hypothetical protein